MPYSFVIRGATPAEIRRKLKEGHSEDWQEAVAMSLKRVPCPGVWGLLGKKIYEEKFVILNRGNPMKARKIDEAREWLKARVGQKEISRPVLERRPDVHQAFAASIGEERAGLVPSAAPAGGPIAFGSEKPPERTADIPSASAGAGAGFIRDIGQIRRTVSLLEDADYPGSIMPAAGPIGPVARDPEEEKWTSVLIKADVGEETAAEIAAAARAAGSVTAALKGLVRFKGPVTLDAEERKLVLFVGPTGVGKTTTLVKVCADFYRRRVPLRFMTIDTYRIGATGQLESYAEIIRAPLDIVKTPEEFRAKLEASSERIIFTDTAGRSPRDEERRRELLSFLQAVPASVFTVEVYLVLSATTASSEMEMVTKRFRDFPLTGVIITKTDEPEQNGRTLDYLRKAGLPAAYFTNGQSVPEDLMTAGPDSLARLILPSGGNGH